MPVSPWDGIRNVLAVRLDNIGDVVMTGPALRALRRRLPDARITLMASPAGSQVAPLLPWVDDVMTLRAVWQDASGAMPLDPAREADLVEAVRARGFGAAVIFTSFSQSPYPPAYLCYLAGVPVRIGQSREFGGSVLSHPVAPAPHGGHQVDRNLHLVEATGIPAAGGHLELAVPEAVQRETDDLLQHRGVGPDAPFIAVAPGASCPSRLYDTGRLAVAVRIVGRETGLPVVMVGSEREHALAERILPETGMVKVRCLVGQTTVPQFAAVVRRAALVIANNSGAMHIADAFRRPMVILFAGTEMEGQWRPRSAPAVLLRRPTDCSPCYGFRCPFRMECLDIPAEEVAGAALRLLAQRSGGAAALPSAGSKSAKGER